MRAIRSILGILIILAAFISVWRIVPPIWANYKFNAWMVDRARTATYDKATTQQLQDEALAKVEELGLPLGRDDMDIVRTGAGCTMRAQYQVTVDLWVYQLPLKFQAGTANNHL